MIVEYLCSSPMHGALLKLLAVFNGKLERCVGTLMYPFMIMPELFLFIRKNENENDVKERSLI